MIVSQGSHSLWIPKSGSDPENDTKHTPNVLFTIQIWVQMDSKMQHQNYW